MGNKNSNEPYQNQINTAQLKYDQRLIQCEPLFYLEYSHKDSYLNANDKKIVDQVVNQLTSLTFSESLKNEGKGKEAQDYFQFLKVNGSMVNDKRLIFVALTLVHELLNLLVLGQCNLQVNLDKSHDKELKRIEGNITKEQKRLQTEMEKEVKKVQANFSKEQKKLEAQLKKDEKSKDQKAIAHTTQQLAHLNTQINIEVSKIKMPATKEPLLQVQEVLQKLLVVKFLPVFAKYNFNVMNKNQFQTHYQDYLENKYREISICLAKLFMSLQLLKVESVLDPSCKFWEHYQPVQPGRVPELQTIMNNALIKDSKYLRTVQNIIDLQVSDLLMQGQIMKMTVRYKIKAFQQEDLDTSIEVGVDALQVNSNREIQHTYASFQKKSTPQMTKTDYKDQKSTKDLSKDDRQATAQKVSDGSNKFVSDQQQSQQNAQEMPSYKQINLGKNSQNPTFTDLKQPVQ